VTLKWWSGSGTAQTAPLARDTAQGYGGDCWSVFMPGVADDAVDVQRVAQTLRRLREDNPFERVIYLELHNQAKESASLPSRAPTTASLPAW
jgi:hypothetical protein